MISDFRTNRPLLSLTKAFIVCREAPEFSVLGCEIFHENSRCEILVSSVLSVDGEFFRSFSFIDMTHNKTRFLVVLKHVEK